MDPSEIPVDSAHVEVLLKAWKDIGDKQPTTVHIFEKNDFFYFFQKDGELAAVHVYGSVTAMKTMGKINPVSFCHMNRANFESVLRYIILVKHYRVEIHKFVPAKSGKPASFELEVRASPGNIEPIEHLLYGDNDVKDSNYILAIKATPADCQYTIGVAAVDTNLRKIQVCSFTDSESFSNLESILVQVSPREVIIPQQELPFLKKIKEKIEQNRILVTTKPLKEFSAQADNDIKKIVNAKINVDSVITCQSVSEACGVLIKYLGISAETDKNFRLEQMKLSDYMRMDHRAITSLNLFDEPGSMGNSVYHILNKTRTPGGARLLQEWIKQPLIQVDKINERLDLIQIFVNNSELRQSLFEDHLRRIPDFQRLSAKFQASKASLQDMYKAYVCLTKLPNLLECIQQSEGNNVVMQENFIKDISSAITDFDKFIQLVETTIDLEHIREGQFLIKPEFDESLGELRQEIDQIEAKLKSCLKSTGAELGLEPEKVLKLETTSQHGYYFRLTMKDEKNVRNDRSLIIIEANKSGIKFRNKRLDQLNDAFSDVSKKYAEQQSAIVQEMLGIASGYADVMNHLGHLLSYLDVIVSLAIAAVCAPVPYCKPTVVSADENKLNFTELRHPIVELQESVSYIGNDVSFDRESTFHLITGPNMGGKSTFIRSVGLGVIMAQIGSFVPADSATVSVVDSVMVRIGASDCQVKGLSTFMAEMLETTTIVENATPHSLVLIDELGRGTSTYDGFGLAWSVSEHIANNIGCFTLFTTHYTELTELSKEIHTVRNYHVKAITEDEKLTLLYKVEPGICDKSFGIHVAKIAKFPSDVIQDAEQTLKRLESAA